MIHAANVIIKGKVQGVFFRVYTRDEAKRLKLKGWVKNLNDGTVEALFIGDKGSINQMIDWCHQGSPNSYVSYVSVIWLDKYMDTNDFSIQY